MKLIFTILCALSVFCGSSRAADELVVYPPVPGLAASEHYKVRVRPADSGEWRDAFAWETRLVNKLCVQPRLACSVGIKPTGGKASSP